MPRTYPAILLTLLAGATPAPAQLVVGNDQTSPTPTIWLVDVAGIRPARALVVHATAGRARGLAADDAGGMLYWVCDNTLFKAPYATTGPLVWSQVAITGMTTPTGLAFDAASRRLYARSGAGFFDLDPDSGVATNVLALSQQDFSGWDYDAGTDAFFGASDAAGLFQGPGLYRIEKPLVAPAITRIAAYPGGFSDVDGLAVGGGRVYLVRDDLTESIGVYDLAGGQYLLPLPTPMTGTGAHGAGAWAPGLMATTPAANLAVIVQAPAPCSVHPGEISRFVVTTTNAGPNDAVNARTAISLPPGVTLVGTTPATSRNGNVLTRHAGTLAPGTPDTIDVRVVAPESGDIVIIASSVSDTDDPVPANNTASADTTVRGFPAAPRAFAVLSTLVGHPSSLVPSGNGARFEEDGLSPPSKSPGGERWVLRAQTTSGGAVLAFGPEGLELVALEGVSPTMPGAPAHVPRILGPTAAIADDGNLVLAGQDTRPDASRDAFVIRRVAGAWAEIAREGSPVPAYPFGVNYAGDLGSPGILAGGQSWFAASLAGTLVTPSDDRALLAFDGVAVVHRTGIDMPWGQSGGPYPCASFDTDPATRFTMSPSASRWSVGAFLAGPGGQNRVGIADAGVVVQEGAPAPTGCVAGGDAVLAAWIDADGSHWLIGRCADSSEFVLRNGGVVASSGSPVHDGAVEVWDTGPGTFAGAGSNQTGGSFVAGRSTAAGLGSVVVVRDGRIVLRSNEPVPLDADRAPDDAVYLGSILPGGFIADSGEIVLRVALREEAAALCGAPDQIVGHALVRIPPDVPSCDPDVNADGIADQDDVAYLINVVGGGDNPSGADPDFNRDGIGDQDDVSALIDAIAGGPCP